MFARRAAVITKVAAAVAVAAFTPAALFASAEQGVWYDPSDLSSMSQDTAGATPAAVGSPVGRIMDKSGRGNHAVQATTASKPILRAKTNLFLQSQNFGSATWQSYLATKGGPAPVADPLGGNNAYEVNVGTTGGASGASSPLYQGVALSVGTHTVSVWVRAASGTSVFRLQGHNGTAEVYSGNLTATTTWQRFSHTFTVAGAASPSIAAVRAGSAGGAVGNIYVFGAQLEAQPAVTQYVPTTSTTAFGAPYWLEFDGVDDFMTFSCAFGTATAMTIALASMPTASVFGMILETNTLWTNGTAGFEMNWFASGGARYSGATRGSGTSLTEAQVLSPVSAAAVVTLQGDIPADSITIRKNKVAGTAGSGDQGTGSFGTQTVYFGRRGGTTQAFPGRVYGLVVRGAATADPVATEDYLATKSGAY